MGDSFDTIVVGGGPGGSAAAVRAAQLGQKTAVVERDKAGGRCYNYTCILAQMALHGARGVLTQAEDEAALGRRRPPA